MENDLGSLVDLYIPRKWKMHKMYLFFFFGKNRFKSDFFYCSSASNRIIHAKDHASIQLTLADVDPETGRMTDTHKMYAICGAIRRM
ncbi:40S ribosomal protein S21, partial [Acromyrmex echinatior]